MRLVDKTNRWDSHKTYVGRKKNYKVQICETLNKNWYYILDKDDYGYNSLWDKLDYKTQEECVTAAEKKINELVNNSN